MAVTLNVPTNLNLQINANSFSQPLGKITGNVKDFDAALAASNARVIAFGASTAVLGTAIRGFQELANATIEVEKNLTDINRVLGLSTSQLQKYSSQLFEVTKQTSSSFAEASKAALEFSRQGIKAEETLIRTKDALTLTRLAGVSTQDAVEALTTTVNNFTKENLNSSNVLNKLVAVEQSFSVSAGDLSEALTRTGQAASEANVSFDQLNALVTTAQQTTARGGAVIGNALKSIFTRLQRSETLDQLEAYNIAVRDVQGNTLPAVTILQNFAQAYKTLASSQKAQLSEQVAGVYQVNILKALVSDLNSSQSIYADALKKGTQATNEADIATAQLNQTLSALLSQTSTASAQLANNIGKVTFEPLAKSAANTAKSIIESFNDLLQGEGIGSDFANGFLKGVRNLIGGPGAIAAFYTLFKLIQTSFSYVAQALPQIAGITTETQNRKNIEAAILQIMQSQNPISQQLLANTGNQTAQASLLLNLAKAQTAEYQRQLQLAQSLAAPLSASGVNVGGRGLGVKSSGGYIPQSDRMAEVIGARAGGYTPGQVVNSPVGGVMNTAETVKYVPGFAQPFINPPVNSQAGQAHRQNSIDRTGVDPYMSGGFVPNFAVKNINSLNYPSLTNLYDMGDQVDGTRYYDKFDDDNLIKTFYLPLTYDEYREKARFAFKNASKIYQNEGLNSANKYLKDATGGFGQNLEEKYFVNPSLIDEKHLNKIAGGFGEKDTQKIFNTHNKLLNQIGPDFREILKSKVSFIETKVRKNDVSDKIILEKFLRGYAKSSPASFKKNEKNDIVSIQQGQITHAIAAKSSGFIPNFATLQEYLSSKGELRLKGGSAANAAYSYGVSIEDIRSHLGDQNWTPKSATANEALAREQAKKASIERRGYLTKVIPFIKDGKTLKNADFKTSTEFGDAYERFVIDILRSEYPDILSNTQAGLYGGRNAAIDALSPEKNTHFEMKGGEVVNREIQEKFRRVFEENKNNKYFKTKTPKDWIQILIKNAAAGFIPNFAGLTKLSRFESSELNKGSIFTESLGSSAVKYTGNKEKLIADIQASIGRTLTNGEKRFLMFASDGKLSQLSDPNILARFINSESKGGFAGFAKGFIPNFAYQQSVMQLEENMSGNKAVFDTDPFPHIRNSGQPTFESAIADHGGLNQALSDSLSNQRMAGLMNKGFVPNFAPRAYTYTNTKSSIVDPSSGISQYSTSLGFNFADQEKAARAEFSRIINALRNGAMNAQQATDAFNQLNTQAGLSAKAQTNLTNILNREVAATTAAATAAATTAAATTAASARKERIDKAMNTAMFVGPMLAGLTEQFAFGNRKRTEMTATERGVQSGLSTGITSITTGASIGNAIFPVAGLGAAIGAATGLVFGLTKAFSDAKLSVEDLNNLITEHSQVTEKNISVAEQYISSQQKLKEAVASGSQSQIDKATKDVASSFREITDVKLATELANTKGGLEDLNGVLEKYKSSEKVLGAALQFTALMKEGVKSGVAGEKGATYLKGTLSKGSLGELTAFEQEYEDFTRSISAGTGGVSKISGRRLTEGSEKKARELSEKLAKETIGDKGSVDELKAFQASLYNFLTGTPEERNRILEKLKAGTAAQQAAAANVNDIVNLTKLKQELILKEVDALGKLNNELLESSYTDQIKKAIFEFHNSLLMSVLDPLEAINQKGEENNKVIREKSADQMKLLRETFVEKKIKDILDLSENSGLLTKKINPAIEAFKAGKPKQLEDLLKNPKGLNQKDIAALQKVYKEYQNAVRDENTNLKGKLAVNDNETKIAKAREKINSFTQNLIQQEAKLLGNKERLELQRRTTLDLEIDARDRQMKQPETFYGKGVVGSAKEMSNIRMQILQRNLEKEEIAKSSSAQSDYNAFLRANAEANRKLTEAGKPSYRMPFTQKIENLNDLRSAINEVKRASYDNPEMETKRIQTLEKLKNIENEIVQGKIKETEITQRLNAEEEKKARDSISFREGLYAGIDSMQKESETMIGDLGRRVPGMFRDSLVDGIKAAIKESHNLGAALMNIASKFVDEISTTLMRSAVGNILGSIGIDKLFNTTPTKKQTGGVIAAQNGQFVSGQGSGDRYPAMLENGEYVLNRNAVRALGGVNALDTFNFASAPRFATGGEFNLSTTSGNYPLDGGKYDVKAEQADIKSMEENMTTYGLENDPYYNKLRDEERQRVSAALAKKKANQAQLMGLLGSAIAGLASIGISQGVNYLNKPAPSANIPRPLGQKPMFTQKGGYIGAYASGGSIGSRLSDTIPHYMDGGYATSPLVQDYGSRTGSGGRFLGGNSSTVNNNNSNTSNAFNFAINVDRNNKIELGQNTSSYEQQDIKFSKNMSEELYATVAKVITNEKRFGGALAGYKIK